VKKATRRVSRSKRPSRVRAASPACSARPGAGKSSLVNMIAGAAAALNRGNDRDRRRDDGRHRQRHPHAAIGADASAMCSRNARLFPHLDVRQNLDYGRRMNGLAADLRSSRRASTPCSTSGHLLDRRPGKIVRRRTPARRARPCATGETAAAAARRAAWRARRKPPAPRSCPIWLRLRDEAAHPHGLCQPRRRRDAPARDPDRAAAAAAGVSSVGGGEGTVLIASRRFSFFRHSGGARKREPGNP